MVSKARLDLPDPDRPVITVRLSRGISTSIPLRLCSRAPRTEMWVSIRFRSAWEYRSASGQCRSAYVLVVVLDDAPVNAANSIWVRRRELPARKQTLASLRLSAWTAFPAADRR